MFQTNWQAMSHQEIYDQVHGGPASGVPGDGFVDGGQSWHRLVGRMQRVADTVDAAGSSLQAHWQGQGADSAVDAVHPLKPWVDQARGLANAVGSVSHEQAGNLQDVRLAIREPSVPPVPEGFGWGDVFSPSGPLGSDYQNALIAQTDEERAAQQTMDRYQGFSRDRMSTLPQFAGPAGPQITPIDPSVAGGPGPEAGGAVGPGGASGGSGGGAGAAPAPGVPPPGGGVPGAGGGGGAAGPGAVPAVPSPTPPSGAPPPGAAPSSVPGAAGGAAGVPSGGVPGAGGAPGTGGVAPGTVVPPVGAVPGAAGGTGTAGRPPPGAPTGARPIPGSPGAPGSGGVPGRGGSPAGGLLPGGRTGAGVGGGGGGTGLEPGASTGAGRGGAGGGIGGGASGGISGGGSTELAPGARSGVGGAVTEAAAVRAAGVAAETRGGAVPMIPPAEMVGGRGSDGGRRRPDYLHEDDPDAIAGALPATTPPVLGE